MAEAGRPTTLKDEQFRQIKECILEGKTLRDTSKECGLPESTLYTWHSDNYLNIADKIEVWKQERLLNLAKLNLEAIMCLGISDKDTIKIVQDTSKFVAETLGKDKGYSKRTEMTGKDGAELPTPILANLKIEE